MLIQALLVTQPTKEGLGSRASEVGPLVVEGVGLFLGSGFRVYGVGGGLRVKGLVFNFQGFRV